MKRLLHWFFIITAAPDVLIGAAMIFATDWLLRVLGLSPVNNPLIVWVAGFFIAFLSSASVIAWRDPLRYRPFITLAALARLAMVPLLAYAAWRGLMPKPFRALIVAEIVTGSLYVLYALRLRAEALLSRPGAARA